MHCNNVWSCAQAAKAKTPCIIFIDEVDAVGSNRRSWENHSRKTLNQMLTEMDGFEENSGVIVIAATNLPEVLDPALTRPGRFDRRVTINAPDIKGRKVPSPQPVAPVRRGVAARSGEKSHHFLWCGGGSFSCGCRCALLPLSCCSALPEPVHVGMCDVCWVCRCNPHPPLHLPPQPGLAGWLD